MVSGLNYRVYASSSYKKEDFSQCFKSVTIGDFDGCHRGHAVLINRAVKDAKKRQYKAVCLTFFPSPKHFLGKRDSRYLQTVDQKVKILHKMGCDYVIVQNFDEDFCKISPELFVEEYLYKKFNVRSVTIGDDFNYGHKKAGNSDTLLEYQNLLEDFEVHVISQQKDQGKVISSSEIRENIQQGQVKIAKDYLGRPFFLEGIIEPGKKVGRTIGIPTINLGQIQQLLPGQGVYVGRVWIEGIHFDEAPMSVIDSYQNCSLAAICIGRRESFENRTQNDLSIEAHVLGPTKVPYDIYGRKCYFYFYQFLRENKKFSELDGLKERIKNDIEIVRKFQFT